MRHLVVVFAEPGRLLRMAGGLGPLQGMAVAGSLTWLISQAGSATRIELTYTVGGYSPDGLADLAGPVDSVQHDLVARLQRYIESGDPGSS